MKVLFLRPKIEVGFEALMPEEIGEKWVNFPSLGSLYVMEYVSAAGFDCRYYDAEALDVGYEEAARWAEQGRYDVVCLPADTYSFLSTVKQAAAIRQHLPEAYLICGGVHPTIYPEETAALPMFDAAVFGDGERPTLALLEALRDKHDPAGIPGVAVRSGAQVIKGPQPELEPDLDALGMPDFSRTPLYTYYSSLAKAKPVVPMVTSRGCPFTCTFCDRPRLAHKLRFRSPAHVEAEFRRHIEQGVTEFSIYDDTFTANRKRALEILERVRGLPQKIAFDIRTRVDTIDVELISELKKAGCERVYFGVETGDPKMQKRLRKNVDLDQARWAITAVQNNGMKALAYFMVGLPGETRAQAEATIRFAQKLRADYYLFEVFVPMPSTEAYDQGLSEGIFDSDYWREFAIHPTAEFLPRLWEQGMTRADLQEVIRTAYRKCYLQPGYIWRSLVSTATWVEFKQKAEGGLSFLRLLK